MTANSNERGNNARNQNRGGQRRGAGDAQTVESRVQAGANTTSQHDNQNSNNQNERGASDGRNQNIQGSKPRRGRGGSIPSQSMTDDHTPHANAPVHQQGAVGGQQNMAGGEHHHNNQKNGPERISMPGDPQRGKRRKGPRSDAMGGGDHPVDLAAAPYYRGEQGGVAGKRLVYIQQEKNVLDPCTDQGRKHNWQICTALKPCAFACLSISFHSRIRFFETVSLGVSAKKRILLTFMFFSLHSVHQDFFTKLEGKGGNCAVQSTIQCDICMEKVEAALGHVCMLLCILHTFVRIGMENNACMLLSLIRDKDLEYACTSMQGSKGYARTNVQGPQRGACTNISTHMYTQDTRCTRGVL
jgi:hypothetical protein